MRPRPEEMCDECREAPRSMALTVRVRAHRGSVPPPGEACRSCGVRPRTKLRPATANKAAR